MNQMNLNEENNQLQDNEVYPVMSFDYKGQQVRVVMRDGEPWFMAADLCAVLGIENVEQAMSMLDPDEKASVLIGPERVNYAFGPGPVQDLAGRIDDPDTAEWMDMPFQQAAQDQHVCDEEVLMYTQQEPIQQVVAQVFELLAEYCEADSDRLVRETHAAMQRLLRGVAQEYGGRLPTTLKQAWPLTRIALPAWIIEIDERARQEGDDDV